MVIPCTETRSGVHFINRNRRMRIGFSPGSKLASISSAPTSYMAFTIKDTGMVPPNREMNRAGDGGDGSRYGPRLVVGRTQLPPRIISPTGDAAFFEKSTRVIRSQSEISDTLSKVNSAEGPTYTSCIIPELTSLICPPAPD